jgi:hypothetical protein
MDDLLNLPQWRFPVRFGSGLLFQIEQRLPFDPHLFGHTHAARLANRKTSVFPRKTIFFRSRSSDRLPVLEVAFIARWLQVTAVHHKVGEPAGPASRTLPFQMDQRHVTLARGDDVGAGQFAFRAARLAEHHQSEVGPGEVVPGR